jgi:hypothetical protein
MGPLQAPSAGFALVTASSLVWGDKTRHIKNREKEGALALDGCCLVKKTTINKQLAEMTVGMMERERGWGGAYGGVLSLRRGRQIEQQQKYKKICCGLR